jgi:hypothetical protein
MYQAVEEVEGFDNGGIAASAVGVGVREVPFARFTV